MTEKAKSTPMVTGKKPGQHPPEIRSRAVELFFDSRDGFKNRMTCASHVADLLSISCADTALSWVRRVEKTGNPDAVAAISEGDELKRLRRENAELIRANGILKSTDQIVAFIDMFKDYREDGGIKWKVEPICSVLTRQYGISISTSGYYAYKSRTPSVRDISDGNLKGLIAQYIS